MNEPLIKNKVKNLITQDNLKFKDLNGNGYLDRYEDWRLPSKERAKDLCSKMTVEEKAGLLMIDTLNADWQGILSEEKRKLITVEHMRRFVFRNGVTLNPEKNKVPKEAKLIGEQITPYQAAEFVNNIQSIAEGSRLGIPVLFKTNARSHVEKDARYGINVSSLAFSPWPKEAGLAAIDDISVWSDFAQAAKEELKSIGVRGLYG
jgi:beta-glucosidase